MTNDPQTDAFEGSAEPGPEHPLILASRVEGTPVYTKAGERIGHVADITLEKVSGRAIYGIMSFGGFLGLGKRYHPVPWSALTFDPVQRGYVVPMDAAELQSAPHYARDDLDKLGGEHRAFDQDLYSYYARYGVTPYG